VKALVTGAHGFVGSWLAKALLADGASVVAFDLGKPAISGLALQGIEPEVKDVSGDLRDPEALSNALVGVDTVFHLAAQTLVGDANTSPVPTFETNVQGTWTLLEACRQGEVERMVFASSDKAYGPHEHLPYTEADALQPTFPYDVSKAAADLIVRSYWHTYEFPVAVTRFANIYGGGDLNFTRLIPALVVAILEGHRPIIRSGGTPERDFLYVEDAAAAYIAIAKTLAGGQGAGEAFNAGWGKPNSVLQVVDLIREVAGSDIEPDIRGTGTPGGEIDRQYMASDKIREVTGWEPKVELREGLSRTLEWYREHPEVRPPG
jgi:CDP-glucose 4,6-dehydratase